MSMADLPPEAPGGATPEGASEASAAALPPPPAHAAAQTSFAYGRNGTIELGPSGFRAPRWPGRGEAFVAYRDVTHIALEPRALAIGTMHGVLLLGRAQLGSAGAAGALADALRERVFALPRGDAHRERFARLDARARMRWPWIAAALVAATGIVFLLQSLVPGLYEAAIYRPGLIALGEWWRYAAAQFLHGSLAHLLVNAVAALIAGAFVERSLGRMGTGFVAGCAGAGAMLASGFGAYQELLGFSGVAAGFFGALVAIEFFAPAEAPASARIPRPILVGVIALQLLLDLGPSPPLPDWAAHTAGFAHLGGFAAGGAAALLVREGLRGAVVAGALASLLATLASFALVAQEVARPGASLERRAGEMLSRGFANPGELNNLAWEIATSPRPTPQALARAEQLAELAVRLTGAREPTILDTLAEVYFAQGRSADAVRVIDDAIALAPGESYYEEQRRRFTGERAAEDRPEAPAEAPPGTPDGSEEDGPSRPGEIELPPGDEITV
jgi:rhomboid protease GluP